MHVCLFDIDGTLIASGGAGKAALEAALADEFGITHLIEKLQLSGRTDRAIIRDLFRLHVIDDTPENLKRLTTSRAVEAAPAWAPDGKRIVFQSDRDGNAEVYVMNADGTKQRRLTHNAAQDGLPDWQPVRR